MRHGQRKSLENRIDMLIETAHSVDDVQVQSEIAKYICVLSFGFIEISLRDIICQYCSVRAQPPIVEFVDQKVLRDMSLRQERIWEMIGSLDQEKREYLEKNIDDKLKDDVQSIVNNRHQIAHGENPGLSLDRMKRYHKGACEFISQVAKDFR